MLARYLIPSLVLLIALSSGPTRSREVYGDPFIGINLDSIGQDERARFDIPTTDILCCLYDTSTVAKSVITAVYDGTQAAAAGLRPGDVILSLWVSMPPGTPGLIQQSRPESGPTADFKGPTWPEVSELLEYGYDHQAYEAYFTVRYHGREQSRQIILSYPQYFRSFVNKNTPPAQVDWINRQLLGQSQFSTTPQLARTPSNVPQSEPPPTRPLHQSSPTVGLPQMSYLTQGLLFGLGVIIALLIYARRAAIVNFFIHDRLPYKLPAYGTDFQVIFKNTQRVNWYGRVIFGIAVNLSMAEVQLHDIRKYWLGRVIVFDSLRRQRQNELARLHLQLAGDVKSETRDKKPFAQLWAAIKYLFLVIFYLFRAMISFLFGFLFIRITIAKLVRSTVVESKNLVRILQAKEAIQEAASELKEYLTTANTFDGRDEVHDVQ
jgi:hypothetical protein